ncbi:MAG: glycosyltransferase family 2 protein [Magnetococcales bacterium]|nr:glycosyltransferase family 2 protein [Magnetococcales bacterium]
MSQMRVAVVMPGFNVGPTVERALLALEPFVGDGIDAVIFIDNNSSDDTRERVGQIQTRNPVLGPVLTRIENARNHGYGGSLKIGLAYVLGEDFTHCLFLHSDDQGDNAQIAADFLKVLRNDPEVGLILASRFHPQAQVGDYSLIRLVGNRFFNLLIRFVTGVCQSDPGTGITGMQTRLAAEAPYPHFSNDLFFNLMLNVFLLRKQEVRCAETPLHWVDSSIGSTVVPWHHVVTMFTLLLGYGVRRLRGHPGFVDPHSPRTHWLEDYPHTIFSPYPNHKGQT